MVRPGGLELPTFWFPPEADSIQLSWETGLGFDEFRCGLGLILKTSHGAWLPRASRTPPNARASTGRGSLSIS